MFGEATFKLVALFLGLVYSCVGLSWSKQSENTRIVGGTEVEIKEAAFIVLIVFEDRPLCGASIITYNFVITAAHCTEGMTPKDLTIRAGSSKVGEGDTYYVSHIIDHPKYDGSNFNYDFSLLKIFGRIFYSENKRAVKLPEENDETPEGEFARALGWGRTQNPLESSDYLRQVELMIITSRECEEAYKDYKIEMEPNKVCAVHPERIDGKDACQGDSGGPLQRLGDGKLIGIVSFGLGCAQAKFAGIYAKVSSVRGWIKETANI